MAYTLFMLVLHFQHDHHYKRAPLLWCLMLKIAISRKVKLVLGYKQTTSQLHDFNIHTAKPLKNSTNVPKCVMNTFKGNQRTEVPVHRICDQMLVGSGTYMVKTEMNHFTLWNDFLVNVFILYCGKLVMWPRCIYHSCECSCLLFF